jgi:hypothetical protein
MILGVVPRRVCEENDITEEALRKLERLQHQISKSRDCAMQQSVRPCVSIREDAGGERLPLNKTTHSHMPDACNTLSG